MKTKKIYLLRYCIKGMNDGIAIYTTLKEANNAAITAVNVWNAYKATVYIMEYEAKNYRYRWTYHRYTYTNNKNK